MDDNLNHASSFSSLAFKLLPHNIGLLWYAILRVNEQCNCLLLTFSSITSISAVTYNDVRSRHMIQQLTVIGCNATTRPQLVKIQTPLFRFAVDLLWICCRVHSKFTTSCHVKMLWICCGFVVQLVVLQIHNKSYKWSLGLYDLLWICCTTSCTTNQKFTANPQQIHSKSKRLQHIHNILTAKIPSVL